MECVLAIRGQRWNNRLFIRSMFVYFLSWSSKTLMSALAPPKTDFRAPSYFGFVNFSWFSAPFRYRKHVQLLTVH